MLMAASVVPVTDFSNVVVERSYADSLTVEWVLNGVITPLNQEKSKLLLPQCGRSDCGSAGGRELVRNAKLEFHRARV